MTSTPRPFASPAPWRFRYGNYLAADGMSVALYDEQTAKRILRAVNSHDQLVAALDSIVDALAPPECHSPDCPDCGPWRKAKSALKLAKGEA